MILVLREYLVNRTELALMIKSKNNSAYIEFHKNPDNHVKFIYSFPTIGKIVREAQITSDDIQELGVHLAFTWNLKESRTTLFINAKERE